MYIPLNLATSIFGMNIQQLNQSGQQIQAFIITALVSTAIAGMIWLVVTRINHAREWLCTGEETRNENGLPSYNIEIRLVMLYFFMFHSDRKQRYYPQNPAARRWVFRSNAWFYILLNSPAYCIWPSTGSIPGFDGSENLTKLAAGHVGACCVRSGIKWHPRLEDMKWDRLHLYNYLCPMNDQSSGF